MPTLETAEGIIAALDAIDARTYTGPLVGSEKTASKGVIRHTAFRNIVLDVSEAIANLLSPSAGRTTLLANIESLRAGKPPAGLMGGAVGAGPGSTVGKDVLSGLTVVGGSIVSTPLNSRTFDTIALSIVSDLATLVGDGESDVSAAVDNIKLFDEATSYDGDGSRLKVPRRGNMVRRGQTQRAFQESVFDVLRVLAEAVA